MLCARIPPLPRISMDFYNMSSERYSYGTSAGNISLGQASAYVHQDGNNQYLQPGYTFDYNYSFQPPYNPAAYSQPVYAPSVPATNYAFPPASQQQMPQTSYAQEVPLHAPIPVSGYSSLIPPVSPHANDHSTGPAQPAANPANSAVPTPSSSEMSVAPSASAPPTTPSEPSPLEYYGNAPQTTFPTPSELLTELNARDQGAVAASNRNAGSTPKAASVGASSPTQPENPTASKATKSDKAKGNANGGAPTKPPETQRKLYFRFVAESVGFTPTDPDTITSHDKKRSYLECLEQYVQWLHDQIHLVGNEPASLGRVSTYRGLTSRSIRTLLVHMEDEIRELYAQVVEAERAYMNLQIQLSMQHASADAHQLRRHSVASCGLPDAPLSSQPFLLPPPPIPSGRVHPNAPQAVPMHY
ncbi:uncharacterized protein LAESUDRAFT_206152 [Laetiporus sulphureus 93-53]|uniref:Uncharacterized protein n=1 Tax=Laetiporus sulphureus 93-53 TaxID=1314785 RepID=A0A165DZ57_9APHY|nr:uncharacterized protein LAESUDRAFT_206152 [Laetiporus sulphureus 93-53]KZT05933.1 hypothetical protein LAESUDRAFT_206152 [Laetiporus sulphureus 93-53]